MYSLSSKVQNGFVRLRSRSFLGERPTNMNTGIFSDSLIDPEVASLNSKLISLCQNELDQKLKWYNIGAAEYRQRRAAGLTAFPKPRHLPRAKTVEVPSRDEDRSIKLRYFVPEGKINGIFLHIHGGGWVLSDSTAQDPYLSKIADEAGMIVASVEYRLAPENPSPAAENDCFDVAHFLFSPASTSVFAQTEKVRRNVFIGGESAGAHLTALTILALRDKHRQAFSGAILNYGVFDLSGTPSARASNVPLVLCREDIDAFVQAYKPSIYTDVKQLQKPDSSPLYADLKGLCRAMFSCGTVDCLLDDTTFMYSRYLAAGNEADLTLYPGGPHGENSDTCVVVHESVQKRLGKRESRFDSAYGIGASLHSNGRSPSLSLTTGHEPTTCKRDGGNSILIRPRFCHDDDYSE